MMRDAIWLTWETQRRNYALARAFDCAYGHFDYSRGHRRLARYLLSALATLKALFGQRYNTVFAQCPSALLTLLVATLKPIRRYQFVIDAHNVVFDYTKSPNRLLSQSVRLCFRLADWVIVSNNGLCEGVRQLGGRPLILPDRLPYIPTRAVPEYCRNAERPVITCIATFADDEPIEVFLHAARGIEIPYTIYVTGSQSKAPHLGRFASSRIRFTDFLDEEDYEALIQHSDLLVDLTTRDNCLVCGAYEGLAVGVPLLLSDTRALRTMFPAGTLFARNSPEDYREKVLEFIDNQAQYLSVMTEAGTRFEREWGGMFVTVQSALKGEEGRLSH